MKLRVKIERIDPLQEGTSKRGYAYARRTVALSHVEAKGENKNLRHTFIASASGQFARDLEKHVSAGLETTAELSFMVETYNFRNYQRVQLVSVDAEGAEQPQEPPPMFAEQETA